MNTKFRKLFTKSVSLIIVMIMIAGSLPLSVFAAEPDGNNDQDAQSYADAQASDDRSDYQLIPNLLDSVNLQADEEDPDTADVPVNGAVDDDPAEEPSDEPKSPSAGSPKAAPDDGSTIGRLTISRNGTEFPSGDSYVMSEAEGKGFIVNYRYSSLQDTVLVVECLEYGSDFAAIPQTNEFFSQVVKLGPGKLALRFNNSPNGNDCTVNFLMKSVALTEEQAYSLIDSTPVPTSRIAVTEYTLPTSTSLSKVLDEGIKGDEEILWEGTPYFNPDAAVTASHTYRLTVSPLSDETGSVTNYYFDEIGHEHVYYPNKFDGYNNNSYRFVIPGAYDQGGSLMEIVGLRIYEPSSLIYLRTLDLPGGEIIDGLAPNCQLTRNSFNKYWNDWKIGERTYDSDKGAYYYDLTPKNRFVNLDTFGKAQLSAGMTLRWRMNDIAVPLTPETNYLAENTVVSYRLPGDGSNVRTIEVRGSEVVTGKIAYRDLQTTFNSKRAADVNPVSNQDVKVGSSYKNETFTSTLNSMSTSAKVTTLPSYTGQVTQLYEFPYQIQPTVMHMGDQWRDILNKNTITSEISGIYFNTWESDSWVALDQTIIDKFNEEFYWKSSNRWRSIGDYTFPKDVTVKSVRIEWSRLGCMMRVGEGANGNYSTVYVTFDYTVNNWTDNTCTDTLPNETQVSVLYRESYDGVYNNGETFKPETVNANMKLEGQDEPSAQDVEQYLWFRLVQPPEEICPDLVGIGTNEKVAYSINGGHVSTVGDLGISIGKYGEKFDYIHNPEITLKLINKNNEIANANDEQLLALFTGGFTAMPKLSGWTFVYTAENSKHEKYTNSVTIPEITAVAGEKKIWLPLPEGYAFTSVVLSYDGEFDISHSSENDTKDTIWLMKYIDLRRYDDIPYLDKKIYVNKDYGYAEIRLNGSIKFDITELADENGLHCRCDGDTHVIGKDMLFNTSNYDFRVYSTRKASISVKGKLPDKAVIYQGESVGDSSSENDASTWDTSNYAVISGDPLMFNEGGEYGIDYRGAYVTYGGSQRYTSYHRYFPIDDINEYLYIELTDEEFIPNLQYSTLWGYPLTDKNITSEIITVNDADGAPHRFLKLQFDENFIRTKVYQNVNGVMTWRDNGVLSMTPNTRYSDEGQNVILLDGKLYHEDNLTGPFKLAFDTVPGTTPGDHHPVGMIYYDLTDFINKGHASINEPADQRNGYDRDRTCYVLSGTNIVDDTMGLSGDTSRKFFYQDGSSWTVEVLMHQEIGASLAPGKNMTYYDFNNGYRSMKFDGSEKNNLNAFLTITGPGNLNASSIYDMSTIVVIPREGKEIEYTYSTTVDGVQQDAIDYSSPSEFSLHMRGVPYIVSNTTSKDPVLMYTTAEDPTDASAIWVDSGEVSDWKSVTGIRVTLSIMEPTTSLNLRLNLGTDDDVDYKTRYMFCTSGGTFEYRESQNGNFIDPQHLNLSEWLFHGYSINCRVFWDIYDEDGYMKDNSWSWTVYEGGIKGIPVTVYDPSGNIIPQDEGADSVLTGGNGVADIFIPYYEKGQYILTGMPETNDSSIPKMTAYPEGKFISYDRDINKVVFKQPTFSWGIPTDIYVGFVKLPQIEATDVEMYVGDTVSADAIVKEFVSNTYYSDSKNILNNGTYKIEFKGIDESIATFENNGKLTNKDNDNLLSNYAFTGVAGGKFTVEATVSNRAGDKVSTNFTVIVKELEDIVVTNIWDDDNNRDGIRPDGVTVQLMKNGVAEGDPVVLNKANKNTYTWPKMIRIDENGDEVEYTLKVTPIADVPGHTGYTQTVDKSSYIADLTATAGGYKFTVKNVHIPEKVDLKVSKVWDDNNDSDKIRPGSIKVELSDGTKVELNEGNNWTYTAKDRFKYENGKEIKYKWKEVKVPDGYTLKVNESGYVTTLVNTHIPATVDVVVNNIFDDDNNRDGIRPDGVTVQLMKNGVAEGKPVVLSNADKDSYTWSDMPRFSGKGEEIKYSISVEPIADVPGHTGYTQTVDKETYAVELAEALKGYKFTVTNVHIPERVDPKVSKIWEDDDNRDGIRPESITVELSDGTRVELNDGNNWTYTAKNRYKYENGKEIKYSWTEVKVPDGYKLNASDSGNETTLVNKHDPATVERTVVAVWIDDDNIDGIRPENLKVGFSDCSSVTISEKISWTVTVQGLKKYEDGKLVDYSWIAPEVPEGYSFSQTVEGTVTTLTYVHKRSGKKVPATGETVAIGSVIAAVLIPVALGMAAIAVCGLRKKENE